jgi:Na+/melibiose symporter-like transporter
VSNPVDVTAVKSAGGAAPEYQAGGKRIWRVGTLTYTRSQLINVFFWLLWGDLCLNIMELVIIRLVPLQLADLGASKTLIAVLTVQIFSALNWVTNPLISTWSDRHRGPRGRRIPFMFWPTPPLAMFVILTGFATNIAGYFLTTFPGLASGMAKFFTVVLPGMTGLSPAAQFSIGVLGVLLLLYRIFDQFPQCVYYYVWADVVPQEMMGRFTSLFRVVATLGGVIFHKWILGYADTHPGAVYIGCGLLYMSAFMLMCMIVKEGEYPPPPPKQKRAAGALAMWFKECFSIRYYWNYYLSFACFRWAWIPFNALLINYATEGVGMSPGKFGDIMGWVMFVQMPIFFLLGPVIDRFHPIRVGVVGFAAMAACGVSAYFLTTGPGTFMVLTMATFGAVAVFQGALVAMGPRVLPRSRYGQFCAANMMVVEGGMLFFSVACGWVLDAFGVRFLWVWLGAFALVGIVPVLSLLRAWKAHGGDGAYLAPGGFDAAPCVVKATQ